MTGERGDNRITRSTNRIGVLQFNCGSLSANLHEIKSRLSQQRPALVLMEETNLNSGKAVKLDGYTVVKEDRATPRCTDGPIRGGGVLIAISTEYENLSFEKLPLLDLGGDNTTETVRIRLFIKRGGKKFVSLDVLNIYIPPIHGGAEDSREQRFDATRTFAPAFEDYQNNNSHGLLIAGDVNGHAWEWDAFSNEDAIGSGIMDFMDDNGFVVANDSLPTYHSFIHQRSDGVEGETAPDVTFLHSDTSLSIKKWQHQNPIGRCHHDVISYEIDLRDCINPLRPKRPCNTRRTSIAWSKVDWEQFNASTLGYYDDYLRKHPCPNDDVRAVFYLDNALRFAFQQAAKELPKGCRPDPICWCTTELEELLDARNEAWATAMSTKNECDWTHYKTICQEFATALRNEKTRAWEEFCTTLNYKTRATKVMKILKSIQRTPPGAPTNSILVTPTGKVITSDRGKAEMFRQHFAKVSKRPPPPKGREAKAKHRKLKGKIRRYVKRTDITQTSLPFTFEELTVAISYLKRRKACGEDEIHNEYLIMSNELLRHHILRLINLVWKTGVFPRSFLNSIICPVYKGGDWETSKSPKDPTNYRPVALTSCICKLAERLVVNRLVYFIESNEMFQHVQSAYRIARCTLDPLMRLVADVNNGFNQEPFQRTLAEKLDLTSAFNKVDHECLLDIMNNIGIPSCFGKFYKGFLNDRRFRVKFGGAISKTARESCGSPQGTVSSPWLFLIYMEAMLRRIMLIATRHHINLGMFADDLTAWTTGRDLSRLERRLTDLTRLISKWTKPHNMQLSKKKGKCSTLLFTNNRQDRLPRVMLDGEVLLAVKKFKLLGIILDAQLTMKPHFEKLVKESKMRLGQLCAVANSCFGPSQLSLRNMYVAYIRSVLDYAAPVWYPLMSKTNLGKLQIIQNKALRKILGVPLSTRIQDMHLECNIQPLEVRYQVATAYQAEKYRRHPPDDPLYTLAHAVPPSRLKRKT